MRRPTHVASLRSSCASHRDEAGIVYCLSRNKVESDGGVAARAGLRRAAVSRGAAGRRRAPSINAVSSADDASDHRRDDRVRHGDRQARRPLRRAPRSAEEHRVLLPGDGPRGPRRRARGGVDGLRPARRRAARAVRRPIRGRRAAQAPRARTSSTRCSAGARSPNVAGDRCSSTSARSAARACGNCDNCLQPPATWDGTQAAQQALSAVYRTGQAFGAAHVVDVLLGNATEKVARHRHERAQSCSASARTSGGGVAIVDSAVAGAGIPARRLRRLRGSRVDRASRPLLRGEVTVRCARTRSSPSRARKARRPEDGARRRARAAVGGAARMPKALAAEQTCRRT